MEIKGEATKYYWHHCIDLENGFVTDGDYDLAPLLHPYPYGFPGKMDGLQVLDVGRASGFFAFEFERRGADVVATDIESSLAWNFVGGKKRREEQRKVIGDERKFSERHITGAFEFARRVKNPRSEASILMFTLLNLVLS